MKKNPIYSEPTMIALLCLPFVYMGLIWNQLPAAIPGHYGPGGHPDRYDSKIVLAVVWAVLSVLIYALRFLPHLDPKGNLFGANFIKIRFLLIAFWSVFVGWFWHISLHGMAPGSLITNVLIGANLLLAGIGNLMYTLKPSFFVGIRTPWTLSNDTVWRKTHHLAGWLWVAGGLAGAVLVWLLPTPAKLPVCMSVSWVLLLIPVGYSYWLYRKLEPSSTQKSN